MVNLPSSSADLHSQFAVGESLIVGGKLFLRYLIPFTLLAGAATIPYGLMVATRFDYVFPIRQFLPEMNRTVAAYFRFSTILTLLFTLLVEGIILSVALQRLRGDHIVLRRAIAVGFTRFPVLMGILLCRSLWLTIAYPVVLSESWIGKAIGLALVAVGLMVETRWYVAPSVAVAEIRNVRSSFSRCATLTEGHRWKLLGILLLTLVPYQLIQMLLPRLYYSVGMIAYLATAYVLEGMYVALNLAIGATVYNDLKQAKDGPAAGIVAEVFS